MIGLAETKPQGSTYPASDPVTNALGPCLVATFREGTSSWELMSEADTHLLDVASVDFHWDRVHHVARVVRGDESVLPHDRSIDGLDTERLSLLCKYLKYPTLVLGPAEWGLLDEHVNGYCCREEMTPAVSHLRRSLFGEKGSQRFIVRARPLAYGWCRERSFRLIVWASDPAFSDVADELCAKQSQYETAKNH